jgi:hypothetical protein
MVDEEAMLGRFRIGAAGMGQTEESAAEGSSPFRRR